MSTCHTQILKVAVLTSMLVLVPQGAFAFNALRTQSDFPIRWGNDRIAMKLDETMLDIVSEQDAVQAAMMASDAWRGFPGVPDIVVDDAITATSPESNRIRAVSPWPHDEKYLAVTDHRIDWNGRIHGVEILINGDVAFALLDESTRVPVDRHDLAAVLTHEMGHVLGLDHSAEHSATMYPFTGVGNVDPRSLEEDDERGIIDVYTQPLYEPKAAWECSVAAGPGAKTGTNVSAWLVIACLLACLVLRRLGAESLAVCAVLVGLAVSTAHATRSEDSMEVSVRNVGGCRFHVTPRVATIRIEGLDDGMASPSVEPVCDGSGIGARIAVAVVAAPPVAPTDSPDPGYRAPGVVEIQL